MTTVEVLKAARTRIERGWVQGSHAYVGNVPDDACCAVTATMWLAKDYRAESAADGFVAQAIGVPRGGVVKWNDAPGRTQAEVLQAFDKAIALADAATSRDAAGIS